MADTASAGAGAGAGAGAVTEELKQKVVKQVQFYFSKHNLPTDKFLKEQISKSENRWVPLDIMLKFNRLKSLTEDKAVVADALKASDVLEVSEDGDSIRRKEPLPATLVPGAFDSATIYAKGFPDNAELEDIEEAFEPFGAVGRVTMRRTKGRNGTFKGSVFVTFDSEESAAKAIAGGIKFMGRPLSKVMLKADYIKLKTAERAAAEEADNAGNVHKFAGVDRVEKGLLRIGIPDMATISQHELRAEVDKYGDLKFFEADKDGATARFGVEGDAEKAKKALEEAKTTFSGQVPTYKVLEGEDAENYWTKVDELHKTRWEEMRRRKNKKAGRGKRKRGNDGGRFGRNKNQRR